MSATGVRSSSRTGRARPRRPRTRRGLRARDPARIPGGRARRPRIRDGVPVVVHDERIRPDAGGGEAGRSPASSRRSCGICRSSTQVLALPWGRTVLMVEVKPTARDRELGAARGAGGRRAGASVAGGAGVILGRVLGRRSQAVNGGSDHGPPRLRDGQKGVVRSGLTLFGWGVDVALVPRERVEGWKARRPRGLDLDDQDPRADAARARRRGRRPHHRHPGRGPETPVAAPRTAARGML